MAVRQKENGKQDLRTFLAGLLDWVGKQPPTSESIAGSPTLKQGGVHIKTILETGGCILGYRPLEADGIEPDLFLSQSPGPACWLQRGFQLVRPATAQEQISLKVFGTWGYMVIRTLAEHYFGSEQVFTE